MIPEIIQKHIKTVKELIVENTSIPCDYKFNPETNTLYIPIYETDFKGMFSHYNNLEKIELCIDNRVENIEGMFYCCHNLKEILFTNKLNLEKVKDMSLIFHDCRALEEIDLSNIITSYKLNSIKYMFYSCEALKKVNFGNNFHTENILSISSLFYNCFKLETIKWRSKQSFNNLLYMNETFSSCRNLKQIDLSGVNFNNILELDDTFYGTSPDLKVLVNSTFKE